MMLAQPAYLWALLALLIPIAIHLLSRKEGRVIPVGSLRHLQETASQQFRGIKLNEILLLLLRLWVLLLFVLLLAGFNWNTEERSKWVVFDASLRSNKNALAFADSLEAQGYSWHWLAKGFPEKEQTATPDNNHWLLLEELGDKALSEVIIVSASRAADFKGSYKTLPLHVSWQTFELPEKRFPVFASSQDKLTVLRSGVSTGAQTNFVTDTITVVSDSVLSVVPIRVALVADAGFIEEARMVKAALTAIQKTLPVQVIVSQDSSVNWLIWLSDKTVPTTKAKVITTTTSQKLLEQVASGTWAIGALTLDKALQENFTIQLASLLTTNSAVEEIVDENDNRSLSSQQLTTAAQASVGGSSESALSLSLLFVFVVSLIAERILAFIRRQ